MTPMRRISSFTRFTLILALVGLVVGLATAAAFGAPPGGGGVTEIKRFSVAVVDAVDGDSTVAAGTASLKVTLKNDASSNTGLGSANVTIPSAFSGATIVGVESDPARQELGAEPDAHAPVRQCHPVPEPGKLGQARTGPDGDGDDSGDGLLRLLHLEHELREAVERLQRVGQRLHVLPGGRVLDHSCQRLSRRSGLRGRAPGGDAAIRLVHRQRPEPSVRLADRHRRQDGRRRRELRRTGAARFRRGSPARDAGRGDDLQPGLHDELRDPTGSALRLSTREGRTRS